MQITRRKTHDFRSVTASLVLAVAVAVALLGVMAGTSGAAAGDTTLVSEGRSPSISANGRFVAFEARAGNLVPDDNNGDFDVFVRDRQMGTTELVGVSSSGAQARAYSVGSSISANGRFVAFVSPAPNLVAGDTNRRDDVFVHDRQTGTTQRVNVDSSGDQANRTSYEPSISADGRFVAFQSYATNLVPDTNGRSLRVFVHELRWPARRSGS